MKPKFRLPRQTCATLEVLCDQYKVAYGVRIPEFVFFEMIVNLGIDYMRSMLDAKTDSMKVEVNEK